MRLPWLDFRSFWQRRRDAALISRKTLRLDASSDPPLRAEIFNTEQMEHHGRGLAGFHELLPGKAPEDLLPRLTDNENTLRSISTLLAESAADNRHITPAAEWLLDNHYLIDEQIQMARRHLPKGYSWQLPRLARGVSAGLPRVYDIALNAIAHGDGRVDLETLSRFVGAYQKIAPLSLGELWAIPIMLRLALIENLRRAATRVAQHRAHRDAADTWADSMIAIATDDPKSLVLVIADMARSGPPTSSAFVAELSRRLQGHGAALALPLTWMEQRLRESGLSIDQMVQMENQQQATEQVSISNSISSLRLITSTDWRDFVQGMSHTERVLRSDPADIYRRTDFATRDSCRHVVEKLARRSGLSEIAVAQHAIELAQSASDAQGDEAREAHVGYFILGRGLASLKRRCGLRHGWVARWRCGEVPTTLYLGVILVVTALIAYAPLASLWRSILPWPLALIVTVCLVIAVSQLGVTIANWIAAFSIPPRLLPRMDYERAIPPAARTLVAVPVMLDSEEAALQCADDLEIRFLANREKHLHFALISDFPDAPSQHMDTDSSILDVVVRRIEGLNREYAGENSDIFFLLHRDRQYNENAKCWMGFERKRGKLGDLNGLLRNRGPRRFSHIVGDISNLEEVRYVITLDGDTQLPREAARQLIASMDHPLNRPVFDHLAKRVTAGHGILQPRVVSSIGIDGVSRYSSLFGGEAGIDPYTRAVSDTYQDLFDEGSFIGKGIYDVDAFEFTLSRRFPVNHILSHDLLEGCYTRSGLVTDVELFENYPRTYTADMARRHRWIRGDWQLLNWLLPLVPDVAGKLVRNPLTSLARWKILDNLRRSLVAPALFGLLAFGWTVIGPAHYWTGLVLVIMFAPALIDAILGALHKSTQTSMRQHLHFSFRSASQRVKQALFAITLLPFEAFSNLDAILRTLWRKLVSRRNLLQWTPSNIVQRTSSNTLSTWLRRMSGVLLISVALALAVVWLQPKNIGLIAPFILAWLLAPAVATWVGAPLRAPVRRLSDAQQRFVRAVARRTWTFFEHFTSAEQNWLPPDNYQQHPLGVIAHRTSPTNIGLNLLAGLSAHDLGYLSLRGLLQRTSDSLATLFKLERYRGHLLNWYDTKSLAPLLPRYVSTVDSGNLVAHLLTLRQGLLQLVDKPVLTPRMFMALQDTVEVLESVALRSLTAPIRSLQAVLDEYCGSVTLTPQLAVQGLQRIVPLTRALLDATQADGNEEPIFWAQTLQIQTNDALAELGAFLQSETDATATDGEMIHDALPSLAQLARESCPAAQACLDDIVRLSAMCQELCKVDYDFLYDESRRLFAIGYNVTEGRRDSGYYDLLASEARLGVFMAIAQGRIAQESWFSLGRLLTRVEGQPVLLSWSGSMFEYLMPLLVMPLFPNSLLEQTCRAVIRRQIDYGRQRGVPWGISESAYNLTDAAQNYQYHAFGVPGLGLQRGLAQELVVAPYATALALHVDPTAAAQNLKRMAGDGWLGRYGFYEAVDFNPKRAPHGQNHTIVRSFMAHHQGMSLLSFAHVLLDRPMQRRFTADPQVQATLLLLQERLPRVSGQYASNPALLDLRASADSEEVSLRVFNRPDTSHPSVQLLSNGRYHVMVTNSGSGYSRYKDMAVTRWREDATCEDSGTFCYFRDCDSNEVWSSAYQPTLAKPDSYEAIFTDPRVEFRCSNHGIDMHTEIVVSPEDDIELRRSRITNRTRNVRILEITSYAEVVLTQGIADALHPAFSKLFVQTEIIPSRNAIICTRRRRDATEQAPWMFHLLALHGGTPIRTSFETDRAAFLGRGNGPEHPQAMQPNGALGHAQGSVLDPIVAIRHRVELQPDQSISIDLVNGVGSSRDLCLALIDKYHDQRLADRVIDLVGAHSRAALGQINVSDADAQTFGRAAGHILFPFAPARTDAATIMRNQLNQSHLWAHAISGDLPILLVQISNPDNLELLRQVLLAHAYWRTKGLAVDLVVWNEERSGYRQNLHDAIMGMLASSAEANMIDRPGGIFVRAIEQISNEDRTLMSAVARLVLSDHNGSLIEQLAYREVTPNLVPRLVPVRTGSVLRGAPSASEVPADLLLGNGQGGFSAKGRQYVIVSEEGQMTPAPWANVISNTELGCVVSESSLGYTWMENAHEYRLTPWHNDPVSDRCGEAFYLRDEESGRYWSPTPLPARGHGRYVTRHGFGYSVFDHIEDGISTELQVYVATDAPVKFFTLRVRNQSGQTRKLSATGYVEWVLGDLPWKTGMQVITALDPASGALFARNAYSMEFANFVAFFDVDDSERTLSGDRSEFIGRNGSLAHPAALRRTRLSGNVGAAMDPCGAIQVPFELADGQSRKISFRLGAARSSAEATALVKRFRVPRSDRAALDSVHELWHNKLDVIQVQTPDPALDVLANGWLLYQVIACRLWARSGYYQSGGAFGYRDQLQDTMSLVHADPARLRSQLLLCASRQFREGDVQHWWHPPEGRGVRTRCSDDYLWLPLATCRYLRTSDDYAVLDEKVGFLDGRRLNPGEESYYDLPLDAGESADLYTHCVLAITNGLRMGEHGLPLIGSGDWNDGMNHVGIEGRGESIWLGFFLYTILRDFAPVARARSDEEFALRCEHEADQLRDNLAAHGWDGAWYRRAYFDDGTPLGTASAAECRIDSIAQSWSVLSGAGSSERTTQALDSLQRLLVRPDAKLVQLLDPPFDVGEPDPGYIRGYVPGVRENGGQYTHAALWAAMAMVQSGRTETAWELFNMINPLRHSLTPEGRELYKSEPYVVAADVYAVKPHVGRGGWTWYTGSAGWMYRLIIESLLGITREGNHLRIEPHLAADWPGFSASYRFEGSEWQIVVRRSDGTEASGLLLGGVRQPDNRVALTHADGAHNIEVILPASNLASGMVSGQLRHSLALLPTSPEAAPPTAT